MSPTNSKIHDLTLVDRRRFLTGAASFAGLLGFSGAIPYTLSRSFADSPNTPDVTTKYGKMRGKTIDGVHTFLGIPYGAPTGGDRRFLAPLPPKPWTEVREMFEYGPYAPQSGRQRGTKQLEFWQTLRPASKKGTSEDCLYLNVWTRGLNDGGKRPVMLWIHGGGYDQGSGGSPGYAQEGLAKHHNVVGVSINHRLNVLGYAYFGGLLGGEFAEGCNQGQLDLVAALQWVHDNIEAFGGDPTRVMIYGQSGGAGKVVNLLGMPSAKGLFTAAAVQSGGGSGGDKDRATETAERLLAALEIKKENARDIQKVSLEKLMPIAAGASAPVGGGRGAAPAAPEAGAGRGARGGAGGGFSWGPVMDGKIIPANPNGSPISENVPIIVGATRTEQTIYQVDTETYNKMTEDELLASVKRLVGDDNAKKVIDMYRKNSPKASPAALNSFITVEVSRGGGASLAENRNKLNKAPTYVYRWDWETPVLDLYAPHTMEIPFVMNHIDACTTMVGKIDPKMKELETQAATAWVSLATTGNPNHKGMPNWPAYKDDTREVMLFNTPPHVEKDPGAELRKLLVPGAAGAGRGGRGGAPGGARGARRGGGAGGNRGEGNGSSS